jgi:hypothetical protein
MKNSLFILLAFLFLNTTVLAQKKPAPTLDSTLPEKTEAKKDRNAAYKEKLTDEDLADARSNYKTKLFEGNYSSEHRSKLSLSYMTNFDLRNLSEISGFELIYGNEGDYSWFEFLITRSSVLYSAVTEINSSAPGVSTDIEDQKDSLFSIGPGVSYRSTMIQNLLGASEMTESTSVFLLYYIFNEDFQSYEYKGIGLRTDFTLNFPLVNRNTEFGWKFSYQLAPLKRAAEFDNESSSARTQLISFMGMSFEFSYFF